MPDAELPGVAQYRHCSSAAFRIILAIAMSEALGGSDSRRRRWSDLPTRHDPQLFAAAQRSAWPATSYQQGSVDSSVTGVLEIGSSPVTSSKRRHRRVRDLGGDDVALAISRAVQQASHAALEPEIAMLDTHHSSTLIVRRTIAVGFVTHAVRSSWRNLDGPITYSRSLLRHETSCSNNAWCSRSERVEPIASV